MSEMYNRIEQFAKERGLSITRLCKVAGVSRSPLTELKMGRTQNLSVGILKKLATALNVTVGQITGSDTTEPKTITPQEQTLLDLFRDMTAEGRAKLMDQAEMLHILYTQKNNAVPETETA